VQGDVPQLGAVAIVRPGAAVTFLHRGAHAGDHPPAAQILQSL
jgi:hypothetical protein